MKAMLVPVGGFPREIEVEGLKDLQKVVGGCIEPCSWVFGDAPAVYCNEEGKFTCEPNRAVYATKAEEGRVKRNGTTIREGDLLEVLYGDFVCIGFDGETGEDRDISDGEIERVRERFGTLRSIESGWMEAVLIKLKAGKEECERMPL